MNQTYSFLIGLRNTALAWAGMAVGAYLMAHPELSNAHIADVVAKHLDTILGGLTVGGAVSLILDYLHQKYNIAAANARAARARFVESLR